MTKIDIISGFLGAGKTTLIKRLLADALKGEQVVLIENEFGEIGIDGGFLKDAGIVVNEMNAGCICCSLVGDFGKALHDVVDQYHPDRILIEPSGVGKLSDVIAAVQNAHLEVQLNSFVTVVDALKAKMYLKNFGEFFENQVAHAGAILLSRTAECPEKRLDETVAMLRGLNEHARIVTTPWKDLTGEQLLSTMEGSRDLVAEVLEEIAHEPHHEHHHHHHDHEHDEHEHDHDHEHDHAYLHAHGIPHSHSHVHENQKAVLNRLSRAIGHLEKVKRMVEEGHDCSEVLIQLAAVRSALDNTGKVILKDHMRHCMVDAVAAGDEDAIDDLCQAIDKFMK